MKFDYLLVGSGLFTAVVANLLMKQGKKCLVIRASTAYRW